MLKNCVGYWNNIHLILFYLQFTESAFQIEQFLLFQKVTQIPEKPGNIEYVWTDLKASPASLPCPLP
jgi:hypothetical protein